MSETGVTIIYGDQIAQVLQISENGRIFQFHKDKAGLRFDCYGSGGSTGISKELATTLIAVLQRFVDTGEIKP